MSNEKQIPANGQAMNALAKAMGAIVFAMVRRLPTGEREAFAKDLAAMAEAQSDAGDPIAEMLLIDMHRAAMQASKL